jgi:hypothetical protein
MSGPSNVTSALTGINDHGVMLGYAYSHAYGQPDGPLTEFIATPHGQDLPDVANVFHQIIQQQHG